MKWLKGMYRDLNDYEILYMVKDEQDNTFEVLVQKYKPLIYKIVYEYINYFKKFGYELDDLMQIGYITLYKASSLYDIYNNSMFYTYFKSSLKKAIITNIRNNLTNRRIVLNEAMSYDKDIPNTDISYLDLFSYKMHNEVNNSDELIIFKNSMPFDLANIFELLYNGYHMDEISILLDESTEIIRKMIKNIKEHALTYKYLFFV